MKQKILMTLLILFMLTLIDTFFTLKAENVNVGTSNKNENYYFKVPTFKDKFLYSEIRGTVYHPVAAQTDDSPLYTADNSFIDTTRINDLRWIAVSRDILSRTYTDKQGNKIVWSGKLKLGDTVWIDYDTSKLKKMSLDRKGKFDQKKYNALIAKHDLIKGYWIIKDVMGKYYHQKQPDGTKKRVDIVKSIDFLQHPKTGFLHLWDRSIIITKRKITGHELVIYDFTTKNNRKISKNMRNLDAI